MLLFKPLSLIYRSVRCLAAVLTLLTPAIVQAQTPTLIHLEAEDATLKGDLRRITDTPGFAGTGYVGEFANTTDTLVFNVPVLDSRYSLTIRYTSPTLSRNASVGVNGDFMSLTLKTTGNAFGTSTAGTYTLAAGTRQVAIAAGQGYYGIDFIELTPVVTVIVPLVNGRAEAENGMLNGVSAATAPTGFSGTGFVTGFDNSDAKNVAISFDIPTTSLYQLSVGYTSPFGFKVGNVNVNGNKSAVSFPGTGSDANFGVADAGKILLTKGINNVVIGGNYGYYGIDYIQLTPATVSLPTKPTKQLVDPLATAEAKALQAYLVNLYGTKVLSGQQDDNYGRAGSEIEYVRTTTGKEPALSSMDLYDYSAAPVAQYGAPNGTAERFLSWSSSGNGRGITSLIWHWRSPSDLKNPANPSGAFYVNATDFDIAAVLADKSGSRYQLVLNDIDLIAAQLKKFQAAGVPVLWRPLHEAAGGWFWWGRGKNPEPFKELWRLMYDRLTNYHQLHNLIWVYSTTDNQGLDWYPGDAYVDITGMDVYGQDRTSSMSSNWSELQVRFGDRRLVALTETANPPDPENIRAYATWWSWFCSWQGDFVRKQPVSFLRRVYNDADVLTKDELLDWKALALASRSGTATPENGMQVFPNPATGYTLNATVRLLRTQSAQIELLNTLGQRVVSIRAQLVAGDNQFQVPVSGVPPGVYQLLVRLADQTTFSQRVAIAP